MTQLDLFAVLLFAVALPLVSFLGRERLFRNLAEQGSKIRVRAYLNSIAILWGLLALVAGLWQWQERDIALIGLQLPGTLRFWGGVALAGLAVLPLAYQLHVARNNGDYRHQIIEDMGSLVHFMPRSARELGFFSGLAVTAGIVEEALYRGILIWYLGLWMDPAAAAAGSLVLFTLAHAYQGPRNALRAGAAGLVLTVLYLLSGSIIPAMLLHIAIDLLGGALGYTALSRQPEAETGTQAEAGA